MANCKTAVSILQEHCAQLGMTPIYNTISQEGLSHQPKFTISCTAGPTVGTGRLPFVCTFTHHACLMSLALFFFLSNSSAAFMIEYSRTARHSLSLVLLTARSDTTL